MSLGQSALFAAVGLAVSSASAFAAPLNLVSVNPDVASGFVAVEYNATTQVFTAQGVTQNLFLPDNSTVGLGSTRSFLLTAIIDNSGNIAGAGSLTVRGDYNVADELLFSSNAIVAFGFGSPSTFEFVFTQQAGSLAPVGTQIGTILRDANLVFPGGVPSFQSSFADVIIPGFGGGNADTFVPAPSAAGLALVGGALAARRRRR